MRDPRLERWAASGAMALTGPPDLPLGPPEPLLDGIERLTRPFPGLDAPALLGERAALMGLWRRGAISCGGSCRILPAAGGFVAVNLPRDEDMESVPAWLELDDVPPNAPATWAALAREVASRDPDELVARAALVGLPVARVGEAADRPAVTRVPLGAAPARAPVGAVVVDLSALWAGPLCADLLAGTGAAVIKVESTRRPDGARRGPAEFFDLLNARKRSVALDFADEAGRRALLHLVLRADVVVEASRPRALEQLGIRAADCVGEGGPQVWVSITGYGRSGHGDAGGAAPEEGPGRVAFGDDAAAAGGLVVWHEGTPLFCADAVADPLTGLTAATACIEALGGGGRWLLDVSMAGVAASLAGPTLAVPDADGGIEVAPPRARPAARHAPASGVDTAEVLAEMGYGG
ncbi:MAG TPA: CoA transferase [Acidimicrobiales bacterium]|nr:CoA transferase [Acidimicrobiales bacterium]